MDLETNWSTLNPAVDTYQWSTLDGEVRLAQANAAQLLYTFVSTPPWAIPTNVPVAAISRLGGVVTVITATPHGMYYNPTYQAADQSSITLAGVADSSFNGTFVLTGTPTADTITFSYQAGPDSVSTLGSLSAVCGGSWAPNGCAEAPASLESWDQYVTAMVNHVGPGVIHYWELWNEANIAETWRGDPKMLVAMAADAKAIIKSVDPNAMILSPSTTINFETPYWSAQRLNLLRCRKRMAEQLACGKPHAKRSSSIDGVAFHGYPMVGEAPEQVQGAVSLLQLAMNQNAAGALPLVDTESSWGLNTGLPAQSDEVAFLGRHLLLEQSMGVQASFWYSYDNSSWGTLWSPSTGLNPVGEADQQVA